jgi:hypothetical protein
MCDLRGREPAWKEQDLEFKPQYHQKQNNKKIQTNKQKNPMN